MHYSIFHIIGAWGLHLVRPKVDERFVLKLILHHIVNTHYIYYYNIYYIYYIGETCVCVCCACVCVCVYFFGLAQGVKDNGCS